MSASGVNDRLYQAFQNQLKTFGPFEVSPRIAIALSGGGDSMALLFLLKEWVREQDGDLVALHVDHGLRETSSEEAHRVKGWCEGLCVPCHILKWEHGGVLSRLQERARAARYDLLEKFCQEHHILHLFLAHHGDDQIETYVHRMSKKSGPDGLAAMDGIEEREGVRVLRPLLGCSKESLQVVLGDHDYIRDPSNENAAFWRAQFRQENTLDASEKLTIQNTIEGLGVARKKREEDLSRYLGHFVFLSDQGYALIDALLFEEAEALQVQSLSKVLTTVGGNVYPVSMEGVRTCLDKLKSQPNVSQITAGGCLVRRWKGNYFITREWGRIQDERDLGAGEETVLWDNRFLIHFKGGGAPSCKRLGPEGWRQVKPILSEQLYPHIFYQSLPAFFNEKGEVIFLPFGDLKKEKRMVDLAQVQFQPRSRLLRSIWGYRSKY